jgi:hypothetical protein
MSNPQRILPQILQHLRQRVGVALLVPIALGAVIQFSAIAANRMTAPKQNQPAPDAIDATVLSFETEQYTVRIFRRSGDLWMNLFNRQANKVEKNDVPMLVSVLEKGITFTNRGDRSTVYLIEVAPDGSQYRLKIQQGDRLTYNQQVAHAPAPSPAPSSAPSPAPSPAAPSPPAAPPSPAPPSTSSSDLTPRQSALPAEPSIPDSATIAKFQTSKYAVRVYDDSGELRMNVYNRLTNAVELKAAPAESTPSGQNMTYTSPSGSLIYIAIVAPVGGYRLQVRQGDQAIYSELGY